MLAMVRSVSLSPCGPVSQASRNQLSVLTRLGSAYHELGASAGWEHDITLLRQRGGFGCGDRHAVDGHYLNPLRAAVNQNLQIEDDIGARVQYPPQLFPAWGH